MRKLIIIAAAAGFLGYGIAWAQGANQHTITLTDRQEAGFVAAYQFMNANYGTSYASVAEYMQSVDGSAGESYCNNVPDANCPS